MRPVSTSTMALQQAAATGQERLALGPRQEPFDLLVTRRRRSDAVGGEVLAPSVERRERRDRFLPLADLFARIAGVSSHSASRRAPSAVAAGPSH